MVQASKLDLVDVTRRLQELKPGETLVYYVGNLASDRPGRPKARLVGELAQSLSKDGKVHLTQKVLKSGGYEYRALGATRSRLFSLAYLEAERQGQFI